MNDEQWQAIVLCDSSYDGRFFYAVRSTGIFCRPSCRSRVPNRDNVVVYEKPEHATADSFRPCKRCKPQGTRMPNEELVAQIARTLDARYEEALSLDKLANLFHVSPYHLQRTFKRIQGQTPAQYLLGVRLTKARELLAQTNDAITDIAAQVGISNASHFSTVFLQHSGLTPNSFRKNINSFPIEKE
jgi:AraC family transcriptional regulator of adaptative response / methylphosphotriester-DNA alkyltransferase methyltransferase